MSHTIASNLSTCIFAKMASVTENKKRSTAHRCIPKIDTTQARSNLEVVRMCLQELGWKEVDVLYSSFVT